MVRRNGTTAGGGPGTGALASAVPWLRAADERWNSCSRAGLYLAVVIGIYLPYLGRLWHVWTRVPEYAHGVLLPLFSAFMLWERREEIGKGGGAPSWWALPVAFAGALALLAGTAAAEPFTLGMSLVLVLLGGLLAVGGPRLFRAAWFPVAFLGFGVPVPDGILIAMLGDPLRDQAARWSAALLDGLGYAVFLNGTYLQLPNMTLEIAYECSGIRGLLAAVPLAAAFAYIFHRSPWQRTVVLLAAVPIGLVSNVLRVAAIAARAYGFTTAVSEAELHGPTGWIPVLFILPSLVATSMVIRWADRRLHSGSR